ncbi:hypothetical protein F5X96DRAFT_426459 [Biscogniauxia mediterranea]|nr:hypothetical protein F5X96DRAFT_426459 [Biscogniauxia mediterranea]
MVITYVWVSTVERPQWIFFMRGRGGLRPTTDLQQHIVVPPLGVFFFNLFPFLSQRHMPAGPAQPKKNYYYVGSFLFYYLKLFVSLFFSYACLYICMCRRVLYIILHLSSPKFTLVAYSVVVSTFFIYSNSSSIDDPELNKKNPPGAVAQKKLASADPPFHC